VATAVLVGGRGGRCVEGSMFSLSSGVWAERTSWCESLSAAVAGTPPFAGRVFSNKNAALSSTPPTMAGARKLQAEIDRTLKRVGEGIEVFDGIWEKVKRAN
jgi:hypothetical protein